MKEKFARLRDLLFSAAALANELAQETNERPPEALPMAVLKIDPDRYYGQGESASLLNMASSTLAKLSDQKKIEVYRPIPNGYRKYKGSVLLTYLKKNA